MSNSLSILENFKAKMRFALITLAIFVPDMSPACALFGNANPLFWAEYASVVVEGSIVSISERPLVSSNPGQISKDGSHTWVFRIAVDRTLRGEHLETREVATRYSNTTALGKQGDEYLSDYLGRPRQFALVTNPPEHSRLFAYTRATRPGPETAFDRHDDFYVRSENGTSLDEIWEGLCRKMPILPIGTLDPFLELPRKRRVSLLNRARLIEDGKREKFKITNLLPRFLPRRPSQDITPPRPE